MEKSNEELVAEAEDALYSALDAYGATKRTALLISALIDAKIRAALAEVKEARSAERPQG